MAMFDPINACTSETQDSDELQEMYCEQCEKHFNKKVAAEGFCVDCVEYMCQTCLKYHRIYMSLHKLMNKDSMPHDFCFEKCSVHQDLLIKFYCSACRTTACSECKSSHHINCDNINHLPTIVDGIEDSDELKDLNENLKSISIELENTKSKTESNISYIRKQEAKAKSTIDRRKEEALNMYRERKEEAIKLFDKAMEEAVARLREQRKKLIEQEDEKQRQIEEDIAIAEKEVTRKVESARDTDLMNLESVQKKSEKLTRDMKKKMSDLMQIRKTEQRCKLFILMKSLEQYTNKLKQDVAELKQNYTLQFYSVESENALNVKGHQTASIFFPYRNLSISEKARVAALHYTLQEKGLRVRSLCLLNNQLVCSDYNDTAIVVLNNFLQRNITSVRIKLPSHPWAIAKVEDNKIAITFPHKRIIGLITLCKSGRVMKSKNIEAGTRCYGIAYSKNKLIVSYTSPAKVCVLDMSGNVLKTFNKDNNREHLFRDPHYLAVSSENETIYVSDCVTNTVTSLTLDGNIKAIYKDDKLIGPYQIAVDEYGTVYVCGQSSNNVHQLSTDLKKVKIILDKHQGIDMPVSVTYCQNNNELYVGLWNGTIKVFNITLE